MGCVDFYHCLYAIMLMRKLNLAHGRHSHLYREGTPSAPQVNSAWWSSTKTRVFGFNMLCCCRCQMASRSPMVVTSYLWMSYIVDYWCKQRVVGQNRFSSLSHSWWWLFIMVWCYIPYLPCDSSHDFCLLTSKLYSAFYP